MRKTFALVAISLFLGAACAKAPAPAPATAAAAPAAAVVASAALDAKAFYAAKCAGCHAVDGSKGLKGKSADAVTNALNGYKAKTYGGAKKEIMEARAAQLSDADVQALAKLVAAF